MLALSLGRAVVAPSKGAFPELQAESGTTWIRTFDEPFDLDSLTRACQEPALPPEDLRCDLGAFEWPAVAKTTANAYRFFLSAPTIRRATRAVQRRMTRSGADGTSARGTPQ
jgi:hypothetical protein